MSKRRKKKSKLATGTDTGAMVTQNEPKEGACDVCGASPVVPETGLCGPCTFGESETAGGNW